MVFEGTGIVHFHPHPKHKSFWWVSVVIIQFKLHLNITPALHFILDPWDRHNVLVYYL